MGAVAGAIAAPVIGQAVGGLLGGGAGAAGSTAAGAVSAQAAQAALTNTQNIANTQGQTLAPYQTLGAGAAGTLGSMLNASPTGGAGGTAPGLLSTFNNADLTANLAPNYQFDLAQGQGAIGNQFAAGGGANGGNAQTGMSAFTTNYAQNAYQNAFNNFQTSQNNIYNRLSNTAGIGANSSTVGATGSTNFANTEANAQMGIGNATAQGIVGATNAITGGINQVGGALTLGQMLQSGNGVPSLNANQVAAAQSNASNGFTPNFVSQN